MEDSAESLGAEYKGKKIGNFGVMSVFSFAATKLITGGFGGALTTDDKSLYDKAKHLSHHCLIDYNKKMFWSDGIGYNYGMSSIQAALILSQLRRIDELLEKKQNDFKLYKKELNCIDNLHLNPEEPHKVNAHWVVNAYLDDRGKQVKKEYIMKEFKKCEIDSRPMFYPLSSQPVYKDKTMEEKNRVAYSITPYSVNLPSSYRQTNEDIKYVCDCYKEIVENA